MAQPDLPEIFGHTIKAATLDAIGKEVVIKLDLGTNDEAVLLRQHWAEQLQQMGVIWIRIEASNLVIAEGVLPPEEPT